MHVSSIIAAVAAVVCGLLSGSLAAGLITAALAAGLLVAFYSMTSKRIHDIEHLSEAVDVMLFKPQEGIFRDNREGELAVLESEIHKMAIRLREQTFELQRDKIYLTDAIADISHQLRTPLTTINLLVTRLEQDGDDARARKQQLRMMQQNLSRIEWLVSSLLKMARMDAGTAEFKHEKFAFSDLVERAIEPLLVPMELRQQSFDYASEGDESAVGDFKWSCEALENIIKNCMEHTPDGGRISVAGRENSIYSELSITDSGPGIAAEDMPHLFERFYRGKHSSENGVGIGLAMARMIIKEQNGTLKAENPPEGGARFIIRFYKGERILK
ncbi:MAG: sensor histidine kinase [Anaerovoracaceae bacterium]